MSHAFTFHLGLPMVKCLREPGHFSPDTAVFVSFNVLEHVATIHPACYRLRGDSGGFIRTQLLGPRAWDEWPPERFAPRVAELCRGLGTVDGFAIQDWMCEPEVLAGKVVPLNPKKKRKPAIDPVRWIEWARTAGPVLAPTVRAAEEFGEGRFEVVFHGTGLSVEEHQYRTVQSYLTLRKLAPEVRWYPVLQSWSGRGYLDCWEMYERAGVDLRSLPVVAVGSTCRRHDTQEVEELVRTLHARGLRNLHMLGMKTDGLRRCAQYVASSDSMAWSAAARNQHIIHPGCTHGAFTYREKLGREAYGNCASCPRWARAWYERQLAILRESLGAPVIRRPEQLPLFQEAA